LKKINIGNDDNYLKWAGDELNIKGVVSSEELYKFLNKSKSKEISIRVEEESLFIKSGRAKVFLKFIEDITLPLEEEILHEATPDAPWIKLPKNFIKGLKFAAQSCSKDMSNFKITCVNINEKGFIEGTDNFRLVQYKIGKHLKIKSCLIPASSAIEVVKLKPTHILQGEDWCHFKTDEGTIISCRTFYENFVNISEIMEQGKEGMPISFPDKLLEILERSDIFSKRKSIIDEIVEIKLSPNLLKVYSENESGKFTESTKFEYDGEKLSFAITPYLLKDILKETNQCEINEENIHFEGENWNYVTSLRLEE